MFKRFRWRKSKPAKEQPLPDPNQNARDQYKREISGDVHVRGEVETKFPPSLIEDYKTSQKEDAAHKGKTFVVEVITMGAVIIYAGLALWQGCSSSDMAGTAKSELTYSKRPWIGFRGVISAPLNSQTSSKVEVGSGVEVATKAKNYGSTPASQVHNRINMKVFCSGFPSDPPYTQASTDIGINSSNSFMPGDEWGVGPISLDHTLRVDEIQKLNSGECGLYLYAKSEYCDIFNVRHYQHFCMEWMRGTPSLWAGCATYGDGDQDHPNEKPQQCTGK